MIIIWCVQEWFFERNSCKKNCISLVSSFFKWKIAPFLKKNCRFPPPWWHRRQTNVCHLVLHPGQSSNLHSSPQEMVNVSVDVENSPVLTYLKKTSNWLFNSFCCLVTLLADGSDDQVYMSMIIFAVLSPASKYRRRHSSPSAATRVPAEKFSSNNATWELHGCERHWCQSIHLIISIIFNLFIFHT